MTQNVNWHMPLAVFCLWTQGATGAHLAKFHEAASQRRDAMLDDVFFAGRVASMTVFHWAGFRRDAMEVGQ